MSDFLPERRGGLPSLSQGAAETSAAFEEVRSKGAALADTLDKAFERAGSSLARNLARAASDGKLSLSELAGAAISAVEALSKAPAPGGGTLAGALASAIGGLFGGARADGGPVTAGAAYLVGERGPEVFRPASSGSVEPQPPGGGVVVNVSLSGGGAPALLRSEAQIAAALSRAVALGRR